MTFQAAFFTLCLFSDMHDCSGKIGGPGTGGELKVCIYEHRGLRESITDCLDLDDFVELAKQMEEGKP